MTLFGFSCGLSGCKKEQRSESHKISEITAVSISCGHTDRSYGYSFWTHKDGNVWFFDAECFTDNFETEKKFENCVLDDEDSKKLLEILEQNESIAYTENYSAKSGSSHAADETAYSFCLTFSDGKQCVTYDRQSDLEDFFYPLAEKYNTD